MKACERVADCFHIRLVQNLNRGAAPTHKVVEMLRAGLLKTRVESKRQAYQRDPLYSDSTRLQHRNTNLPSLGSS